MLPRFGGGSKMRFCITYQRKIEMRKVTEITTRAFANGASKRLSNTETDGQFYWLHGNLIAERYGEGSLRVRMCGWPTPTTRERLNGVFRAFGIPAHIYQKDWEQRIVFNGNDTEMDPDEWHYFHNVE